MAFQDIATRKSTRSLGIEITTSPDLINPVLTSPNNAIDLGTGVLVVRFSETLDTKISSGGSHQFRSINLGLMSLVNDTGHSLEIYGAISVTSLEDDRALRIVLNETQRVFAVEASAAVVSGGDRHPMTLSIAPNFVKDVAGNGNLQQDAIPLIETVDVITATFGTPASIDLATGEIVLTTSETLDLSSPKEGSSSSALPGFVDISKYDLSKVLLTDNSNINNPLNVESMNSRSFTLEGASIRARMNLGAPLTMTILLTEIQRVKAVQASSLAPRLGSPMSITVSAGAARDVALLLTSTADGGTTPDVMTLVESPDTTPPTLVRGRIDYSTGLLTIITSETLGSASGTPLETMAIGAYASPSLFDADADGDFDLFVGIERGEIVYMENYGTATDPLFQYDASKTFANSQVVNGFFSSEPSITTATKAASGYASVSFLNFNNDRATIVADQQAGMDMIVGQKDGTLRYYKNDGNGVFTEATTSCNAQPSSPANCNPFTYFTETGALYARAAASTLRGKTSLYISTEDGYLKYMKNEGAGDDYEIYDWNSITSSGSNPFASAQDHGSRSSIATATLYKLNCGETDVCPEDVLVGTAAGTIYTYSVSDQGTPTLKSGAANPARLVDVSSRGGYASPSLADLDADGDYDLVVGAADGTLHYYENTGTTTLPDFSPRDPIVYDATPLSHQSPFTGLSLDRISLDQFDAPSNVGPKIEITVSSAAPVSQYYDVLNITLTKTLLSRAILISGTPGGDGSAAYLRISPLGVRDLSLNFVPNEMSVLLEEIPDTIPPFLISAAIKYSKGILHLVLDEYVGYNITAGNDPYWSLINLTAISLTDVTGARHVPLTGATFVSEVNTSVYIILTEEQRVDAIEFSGTPGGDGHTIFLDIDAGGLTDLAGNPIAKTTNVTVSEAADVIAPIVLSGVLDYATGRLTITAQETIDASSIITSKIYVSDVAEQRTIQLSGTSLVAPGNVDGISVTIQLTEEMRSSAISISGVTGGNYDVDGVTLHPVVLDFDANALTDIAQTGNSIQDGIFVTEIEDLTPPIVLSGTIDYNDGRVRLTASETIDATPPSYWKVVDLEKIFLINAPTWDYNTQTWESDKHLSLRGANVTLIDGTTITVVLTEAQRAKSVTFSNTPGGGGTGSTGDGEAIHLSVLPGAIRDVANNTNVVTFDNVTIAETGDTTRPILLSQAIDYGLGRITMVFSETIDLTPPLDTTDLTKILLDNTTGVSDPGAVFIQHLRPVDITMQARMSLSSVDSTTVVLLLSETERTSIIVFSGTTGGDSLGFVDKSTVDPTAAIFLDLLEGAFRDLSGNLVVAKNNNRMVETPDNTGPTFRDSGPQTIDYSTGILVLRAHKTLEIAPYVDDTDPIDLSKFYLSNSSTSDDVQLTGAQVTSTADSMLLTIVLTEAQRVATLVWSNTPGGGGTFSLGDQSPILLNLKGGAVMDTARNLNNESRGLAVTETEDTNVPNIASVAIDYNDGSIRITSDETMDVTPQHPLVIRLDRMVVSNTSRANTLEWLFTFSSPVSITEEARISVTQSSNSAVGILRSAQQDSWTLAVTGTHGITEAAGAVVSQGGTARGTLATSLANVWKLTITSANIVEEVGSSVSQTPGTCATTSGGADRTADSDCGAANNEACNQQAACEASVASPTTWTPGTPRVGVLQTGLTGYGTTEIYILAASGVTFDSLSHVILNGGTTTVLQTLISAATHSGVVREIVVHSASNVVLDSTSPLTVGGATFPAIDLASIVHTGVVTQLRVNTITPQTFDLLADLQVGGVGGTTISQSVLQGVTESVVFGTFDDNPPVATFVYKTKEFSLVGANVIQTDGLTVTIVMTEEQRSSAIRFSGTPGGDTSWGGALVSIANGAMVDMANNSVVESMDFAVVETPDTTNPTFVSGRAEFGNGMLFLNASEILDVTPTSLVDLSKLFLVDTHLVSNTFTLPLTGAQVTNTEDSSTLSILLTESQRTESLLQSGIAGGDGFSLFFKVDAGGTVDVAGNPSVYVDNLLLAELADTIQPSLVSGVLDLNTGTGVLTLTSNEFLDVTQGSAGAGSPAFGWVNLSQVFLANEASGLDVPLAGATVAPVGFNFRTHDLVVLLTEAQRAAAIGLSGTTGGDGTPLVVHVLANTVFGFGTRGNRLNASITLEEIPDTTPPSIQSTALDLATGILTLSGSETIDATPNTLVDPSLLTLVQSTGDATNAVGLDGASVSSVDGITITVTLTELQRVAAIAISATPGGDSVAMKIDCGAGAVRDVATNPSTTNNDVVVNESPDDVLPQLANVTIDFNDRKIVFKSSETILLTSLTDQTKFVISDVTNVHSDVSTHVPISGATLVNTVDGTEITFILTEAQKVGIQQFSGTPGGDGTHSVLDLAGGAFTDVALNPITLIQNVRVYEISDTTQPTITIATIDYGLSTLTLGLNEFVSAGTNDGSSQVTLSSFVFRDVHTMMSRTVNTEKTRFASTDHGTASVFDMNDAQVMYGISHLTTTITFTLSERTRVALVQMSGVPGGDRYPLMPANSVASHVCADNSVRVAAATAYANGDGDSEAACAELVSKGGAPSQDEVQYAYYDPGAVIVDVFSGGLRDVANNSNAEITDCRERDTRDQTLFVTLSSCPAPSARGIVLVEIPDTVNPNVTAVTIDFALGEIRITATETMDASPSTDLVLGGLFLGNDIGGKDVSLVGASVELQIAQTLTITMTETQRIAAMSIAGTPGGDGTKLAFTVADDVSVRDMSSNFMDAANISGDAITELPDTLGPVLRSCIVFLGNGTIEFVAAETVDVFPKTDVHVELMNLRGDPNHALGEGSAGWTGGGNVTLAGAAVLTDV